MVVHQHLGLLLSPNQVLFLVPVCRCNVHFQPLVLDLMRLKQFVVLTFANKRPRSLVLFNPLSQFKFGSLLKQLLQKFIALEAVGASQLDFHLAAALASDMVQFRLRLHHVLILQIEFPEQGGIGVLW